MGKRKNPPQPSFTPPFSPAFSCLGGVTSRVYEAETDTGSDLRLSESIRSLQSGLCNGLLGAGFLLSY